jgi:hypothetical protein
MILKLSAIVKRMLPRRSQSLPHKKVASSVRPCWRVKFFGNTHHDAVVLEMTMVNKQDDRDRQEK